MSVRQLRRDNGRTAGRDDIARRKGYHHGNLEEALLEAARRLIAEKGSSGFLLSEAAKMAGVTPAAVYRHFTDRRALMVALARRGFAVFGRVLAESSAVGGASARQALEELGRLYMAFARSEPGYFGAMSAAGLTAEDIEDVRQQAFAPVLDALGEGRAPAPDEVKKLVWQVTALSQGLANLETAGTFVASGGTHFADGLLARGTSAMLAEAL